MTEFSPGAFMEIDPIKLCCGRPESEHRGVMCPDGKVMCCICFERFMVEDLNMVDGVPENVCKGCANVARR